MMQTQKCPICKKRSIQPINLKCQHHPCFACASKIMMVDPESGLQTKYKIVCPACRKKTVTYDIRHLIINMTEQDQDMYVTNKYIHKKAEVLLKKDNFIQERGTQSYGHSKKNSIQSIISNGGSLNPQVQIECRIHSGFWLQYFCYDCHKKDQKHVFQCSQCYKKHKAQHKHKVLTVKQGLQKILSHNKNKVENGIPTKKMEIQSVNQSWTIYQDTMNSQYEKIYKQLNDQFRNIYKIMNEKYQNIRKSLKNQFLKQTQEIKNFVEINKKLKQSFKSLQKMQSSSEDPESQINFYIYYRQIQDAINSNSSKLGKNLEFPRLVKRTTLLGSVLSQFIEVEYNWQSEGSTAGTTAQVSKNHHRNLSYGSSPLGSARFLNYTGEKGENVKYDSTKKNSVDENWRSCKQNKNIKALTPKSGLLFDFNKLTL